MSSTYCLSVEEKSNTVEYQKVSTILGIPISDSWSIVDKQGPLVMVHYEDNADMQTYGDLRGVLVDIDEERVVVDSFGYTPTAITSSLEVSEDGNIEIEDTDGKSHVFPVSECKIKRAFEGVVMRAIWYKGSGYLMTHRRIDPVRSRWGTSVTFVEMYNQAGGPTANQLFDLSKPYSDTCYNFLVVHPDLLVATKQHVEHAYIVCLDETKVRFETDPETSSPGIFDVKKCQRELPVHVTKNFMHSPPELSVREANGHMANGYYLQDNVEDPRMSTGEAVMLYRYVNGEIVDIVKVCSVAYGWRTMMRGNNPNIAHQFYTHFDYVYKDFDEKTFRSEDGLIPIEPVEHRDILAYFEQSRKKIFRLPMFNPNLTYLNGPKNRDMRIYILWLNYFVSVPINKQQEVINYYQKFINDRNDLIAWLQYLERNNKTVDYLEISDRAKAIIKSVRVLAEESVRNGTNVDRYGRRLAFKTLLKRTVDNLMKKEKGSSLYALIRDMRKYQKQQNLNQ